jgi:regulator of sigma E protease
MLTLFVFLFVLGLLVFAHEAGHCLLAKQRGIKVEEFGFGFPPRIIGIRRREGRWEIIKGKKEIEKDSPTVYSLNWIPFGGFVRIKGESGEGKGEVDSFISRKIWERGLVVSGGILANILLTILLLTFGFSIGLPQSLEEKLSPYAKITNPQINVLTVLPNSPAEKAGLKSGDIILTVNQQKIYSVQEFRDLMAQNVGQELTLSIKREDKSLEFRIVPEILPQTGKPGLGIGLAMVGFVRYPVWLAIPKAIETTGFLIKAIGQGLWEMIHQWISGQKVEAELAGPVGIAVLTGKAAHLGLAYLLQFMAILSINLAVINAFPFPALDGGRLLFLMIEKIRGRPLNYRTELIINNIGFVLLLLLVIVVTYYDLGRYGSGIVQWAQKLIQ